MTKKSITATNKGVAIDASGSGNTSHINITRAAKFGSLLNPLLELIIEKDIFNSDRENQSTPDPEHKINFNDVKVYAVTLKECISLLSIIEEQIDAIDNEVPNSKERFKRAIKQNYTTHKNKLLTEHNLDPTNKTAIIETIKNNSDKLIERIADTLLSNSEVDLHDHPIEDVRDAINLVICYGFINCKILENPNDY